MPLHPALKTIHPQGPRPREVREVSCPRCGHCFDTSVRAITLRCPACTTPLEFKDLRLKQKVEGDVSTMGHVCLAPPSEMLGRLVCGQFTNEGCFQGRAVVYGSIELLNRSLTTGEIVGKSLKVHWGASLRAKAHITPRLIGSPAGRPQRYRPLRRLSRRALSVPPNPIRLKT